MQSDEDEIVLVCPPGAESGTIAHGAAEYLPYREDITRRSRWLVRVPIYAAKHFCRVGGFWPFDPEAKSLNSRRRVLWVLRRRGLPLRRLSGWLRGIKPAGGVSCHSRRPFS